MHASLIRRQLSSLIPPKIATPSHLTSGGGEGLTPLVNFYSKLPKGPSTSTVRGIKGRLFNGKNASASPIVVAILAVFGIGYTIDYQMHLKHHKNRAH